MIHISGWILTILGDTPAEVAAVCAVPFSFNRRGTARMCVRVCVCFSLPERFLSTRNGLLREDTRILDEP